MKKELVHFEFQEKNISYPFNAILIIKHRYVLFKNTGYEIELFITRRFNLGTTTTNFLFDRVKELDGLRQIKDDAHKLVFMNL